MVAFVLAPRARRAGPLGRFLAEFYPLALTVGLYSHVGLVNAARGVSHDGLVQAWEQALFGFQPSLAWIRAFPSPAWSTLMHAAYLSYYGILVAAPVGLWLAGRRFAARVTLLLTMTAFYLCYTIFLVFPVAGPRYVCAPARNAATAAPVAAFTHRLLEGGSAWGTAFPSSHVAAALVAAICAWRGLPPLGLALVPPALLLSLATVYGQLHYAVDALAGAALAAVVLFAGGRAGYDAGAARAKPEPRTPRPQRSSPMMSRSPALALLACLATPAFAAENLDWATIGRIRDEGFRRSQVMETAAQLTDVHGPRLSGSPQYKKAAEWARQQLESWGLQDSHLEAFPFGRGWSFERSSAHVVAPASFPLVAIPKAWTAGTSGVVRGKAVRVRVESEADVEKWKGKLAGLVVWAGESRELKSPEDRGVFQRYSEKELDDLEKYQLPGPRGPRGPAGGPPFDREAFLRRRRVNQALEKLYAAEKPLAVVEPSERDANVLRLGSGGSRKKGDPQAVTQLVVSAVQWSRVARLLERKLEVEVEIDVKATFHEDDTNGYNVVAELPGSDRKGELVMIGAHLDSWHPGTGATDNGAGSAVMMEVMRILKATGVKPRRTIRIGLWGGEEQGLIGSRAYVSEHFASRPQPPEPAPDELPAFLRSDPPAPMTLKPDHAKLAAYFNLDNGTGKIRGIYLQENAATKPVFEGWMAAVEDVGATRVSMRNTGGTDHQSFDSVGLPGFQFIQDPIEYSNGSFFGTHQTDMDVYDRLQREDLMQAAVVIATFAYTAANRDEMLPRKPLPPVAAPAAAPAEKVKGAPKAPRKAAEAAPGAR